MSILKTNAIQSLSGKALLNSTGSVLQVVQAFSGDTFSTTATIAAGGAAVTGLSVSITPTSSSSKILLLASLQCSGTAASTQFYSWFVRNSTKIGAGTSVGNRVGIAARYYLNDSYVAGAVPMAYLDSPSSISAQTYYVYIGTEGAGTVYTGRTQSDTNDSGNGARGSCSLIAMEISG